MNQKGKLMKEEKEELVSSLELPEGMRIEVVDNTIYFISSKPTEFRYLYQKLKEVAISIDLVLKENNLK